MTVKGIKTVHGVKWKLQLLVRQV